METWQIPVKGKSPFRKAIGRFHDHVKKHRYVSRGLKFLGHDKLSAGASLLGYGRRRLRGGTKGARMIGPVNRSPLMRLAHRGHALAKKHKVASRLARHLGYNKVADHLALAGYGKKRRMRGGSFFGKIGSWVKGAAGSVNSFLKKYKPISRLAGLIPHPLARGVGAVAGLSGYGRRTRKRVVRRKRMVGRGLITGSQFGGSYRSGPCQF